MCWERRPQPCPRPRSARGPLAPPAAAPDWLQEGDRGRWSARPRRTPPPQHAPPFPLSPARSRPTGAAEAPKKARPPGTESRSSRIRSARSSSIPGGRGRARGRREGAIQRGCAGMLSGRSAAAVRLPAPASADPRAAAGRAQPGLPAPAPAYSARRALVSVVAARPAHGHRLAGGGGPESPAWGRSEAAAGEGGGGGVDSAAAACLGTTFYIWPLVWGPRGRRGWRRETLGGGRLRPGRGPGGGGKEGAGPTGQCTWGSSPG